MSDLQRAIRNLVRQEYQKATGGSSGNRLGVVSLVNSDGTAAIMVDGQLVTATTLYPCVPGQQVIVMPAGGIYKAAPISPNAPAVEIIHPPFFSGGKSDFRFYGQYTYPPIPTGVRQYLDLLIQQSGDSKIYVLQGVDADFVSGTPIGWAMSRDGKYLATSGLTIDSTQSRLRVYEISSSTLTPSGDALDPVLKVFPISGTIVTDTVIDISDTLRYISKGLFGGASPILKPDGSLYYTFVTSARLYQVWKVPLGGSPVKISEFDIHDVQVEIAFGISAWNGPIIDANDSNPLIEAAIIKNPFFGSYYTQQVAIDGSGTVVLQGPIAVTGDFPYIFGTPGISWQTKEQSTAMAYSQVLMSSVECVLWSKTPSGPLISSLSLDTALVNGGSLGDPGALSVFTTPILAGKKIHALNFVHPFSPDSWYARVSLLTGGLSGNLVVSTDPEKNMSPGTINPDSIKLWNPDASYGADKFDGLAVDSGNMILLESS